MTVKAVRKEMDMSGQVPQNAPQDNSQFPPTTQPQLNEIPDHTHPEYDQMMVKLQEIESQLQGQAPGGINQETLDEGKPEKDKGKPTGNEQPITDNQGNWDIKKVESFIRSIIKEELTGVPEKPKGKDLNDSGPDNTSNIPQTQQPANGTAPSGGGFDSDDKTNKTDGDETVGKLPKPGSEHDKIAIKKNKLDEAKSLIEKAKALMKEANGEDPTAPNPGATEQDPKKMDDSTPNKSPAGGTETLDGISEDPEANVPNDKRPKLKEGADEDEEDDKLDVTKESIVKQVFANLKKEVKRESGSQRQSFVGLTSASNDQLQDAHAEAMDAKTKVTNTMKEYLQKAGHGKALGYM